jgi:hypothetical protein
MENPEQDDHDIEMGNSFFYFLFSISKLGLSRYVDMLLTNPVDMKKMEGFLTRHKEKTRPKGILIL